MSDREAYRLRAGEHYPPHHFRTTPSRNRDIHPLNPRGTDISIHWDKPRARPERVFRARHLSQAPDQPGRRRGPGWRRPGHRGTARPPGTLVCVRPPARRPRCTARAIGSAGERLVHRGDRPARTARWQAVLEKTSQRGTGSDNGSGRRSGPEPVDRGGLPRSGRLAQWKSAAFTPQRSLVRTQHRPRKQASPQGVSAPHGL